VLTDAIGRIRNGSNVVLRDQLEHALQGALLDHSTSAQTIGLGIHCRIQNLFWLNRRMIYTPTWHCLPTALSAITRLAPYMQRHGSNRASVMLKIGQLDKMGMMWEKFKCEYADICQESGWDCSGMLSKFAAWEMAAAPARARMMERHSRWAMFRQDPQNLQDRSFPWRLSKGFLIFN
jgi:hypothetical protein